MRETDRKDADHHSTLADLTEAGDIGDEQLPAGDIKTDKQEWSYTSDQIKEHRLPDWLRQFLNGL